MGNIQGTARAGLFGGPFEADRGESQVAGGGSNSSSSSWCWALLPSSGVVAVVVVELEGTRRERVQDAETLFCNSNPTAQVVSRQVENTIESHWPNQQTSQSAGQHTTPPI